MNLFNNNHSRKRQETGSLSLATIDDQGETQMKLATKKGGIESITNSRVTTTNRYSADRKLRASPTSPPR